MPVLRHQESVEMPTHMVRVHLGCRVQVYTSGIALYAQPDFRGPPLFSVVLDAIGDEIKCAAQCALLRPVAALGHQKGG